jgi:P27 family predicted phage terminase small subunit
MRGRKPTPTVVKFAKRTQRPGRQQPERVVGLRVVRLEAPDWLAPEEATIFEAVAATMADLGLSTALDSNLVVLYAQAWIRYRRASELLRRIAADDKGSGGVLVKTPGGGWKRNPVVASVHAEAAELTRLGSELGLSPVARIRLGIAAEGGDATAAKFFS